MEEYTHQIHSHQIVSDFRHTPAFNHVSYKQLLLNCASRGFNWQHNVQMKPCIYECVQYVI